MEDLKNLTQTNTLVNDSMLNFGGKIGCLKNGICRIYLIRNKFKSVYNNHFYYHLN